MAITNQYKRIPCDQIIIRRDERQRRDLAITEEFKNSIRTRGVLNPIIVTRDLVLVAGERRLTASIELSLPDIPCRFLDTLDQIELQIVELEENAKRTDLTWQENTDAIGKLHKLYQSHNPGWTQADTARELSLSPGAISQNLRVAESLASPQIRAMPGFASAYNTLKRLDTRRADDAMIDIVQEARTTFPAATAPPPTPPEVPPILHTEFAAWAESYVGEPFNFLHCDFPYGVNVFDGKQAGGHTADATYKDTVDVYFSLLNLLADHHERLLAHSAHILFWFSMEHYEATMEFFRTRMPSIIWQPHPLIWYKSDNSGILPDPRRAPRRIYETALMGTRGDRFIVKPTSNVYACPIDRTYHPSTKPLPMLEYFFQMFVDSGTKMLDPTCGGGSALRAADKLGATSVLGLERDEEHFNNAVRAFRTYQNMRKITNG